MAPASGAEPLVLDRRRRFGGDRLLGLALGLALIVTAFVADGGLRIAPTTRFEIAWILIAGAAVTASLLLPDMRRPSTGYGAALLASLGVLTAVTAASIAWSVSPSTSWEETNRTLAYLAVATVGVVAARRMPDRWPALLYAVGFAAVVVSGWAVLTKVFPAQLAAEETFARLRAPFGYWNAVGGLAVLGMPPLLWLAARRSGHAAVNALAWPGMTLLLVAMMLSYSRGALVAVIVGLAFWLVVTPVRLRATLALAAAVLGTAAIVAWVFSQRALTADEVPVLVRADGGAEFGLLVLLVLATLLVAGLLVNFSASRRPTSDRTRRLVGIALLVGLAVGPVVGFVALSKAPGGIGGQASTTWQQITNPDAQTPGNTPDRMTEASSVRARYWREALAVHDMSPEGGVGAGGYVTARTRVRTLAPGQTRPLEVRHAHGYVVQTLADLGWAGIAASLLVLLAWGWSVVRTCGLRPRDRGQGWDAERVGMATLAAVGIVYGAHSLLDFTWFIPGLTVPAMLCAGWLAAAQPLRERLAASSVIATKAAHIGASRLHEPLAVSAFPITEVAYVRARRPRLAPWRWFAGAAAVLVALTCAWSVYQPLRAVNAADAALARMEAGDLENAWLIAHNAARSNPLSVDPLWDRALIDLARNRPVDARAALEEAVSLEPANAETWRRLGRFRLSIDGEPKRALKDFKAAYFLDPLAAESASDVLEAQRAVKQPAP